jgi:hypothetical protein
MWDRSSQVGCSHRMVGIVCFVNVPSTMQANPGIRM